MMRVIAGALLVLSLSGFKWADLWVTKDQQAANTFQEKDFQKAATQFRSPKWRAAANYRAGNYAQAIADYKDDETPAGYYNLGNALAKAGQLEGALYAYNKALELQKDFPDAEFNKALIEKLLEQQKQNQNQQKQQNSQDQKQKEAKQNKSGGEDKQPSGQDKNQANNDEPDNGSDQQQQAKNKKQDGQNKKKQQKEKARAQRRKKMADLQSASLSENEQADLQWMQQIVDDPGGLLRRKFLRDHQRRLQGARKW